MALVNAGAAVSSEDKDGLTGEDGGGLEDAQRRTGAPPGPVGEMKRMWPLFVDVRTVACLTKLSAFTSSLIYSDLESWNCILH